MLLCGALGFFLLLGAAVDPAWVRSSYDVKYTGGSADEKTGSQVNYLGLTVGTRTAPTYDPDLKAEFTATAMYPSEIMIKQLNAFTKATKGPEAVSIM